MCIRDRPYAWARISCRQLPNIEIRYGDFWSQPLGDYGLVYAFLSPDPMPRLWDKAGIEMKPGALLVSNSFAVPGAAPTKTIDVGDGRRTQLHCYDPAG